MWLKGADGVGAVTSLADVMADPELAGLDDGLDLGEGLGDNDEPGEADTMADPDIYALQGLADDTKVVSPLFGSLRNVAIIAGPNRKEEVRS